LCEDTGSVLLCEKDGATHRVDVNDVLYIETVDRKSCVYTKDEIFVITTPLSQLEEALTAQHFIRISRAMLINIFKIKSISSRLNYRLTAEMSNGEKVVISRHYRSLLEEAVNELAKELGE
jgi:DNA-binding LytR/AlgR family response regulator